MSLSKKHLSRNKSSVSFDMADLGYELEFKCPEIIFALLMGSARDGTVKPGGDIDLAIYLAGQINFELFERVDEIVNVLVPGVRCDLGCLNGAEPVYRFEALKGSLLFTRNLESWVRFYSITSREYESALIQYDKQLAYRLATHGRAT